METESKQQEERLAVASAEAKTLSAEVAELEEQERNQEKIKTQRMAELTKQYGADRFIVDSSCDWGVSDALSVPKTAKVMLDAGIDAAAVRKATYENAVTAYGYSGQIDLELLEAKPAVDQRGFYGDSSVLRGQEARVDLEVPN